MSSAIMRIMLGRSFARVVPTRNAVTSVKFFGFMIFLCVEAESDRDFIVIYLLVSNSDTDFVNSKIWLYGRAFYS